METVVVAKLVLRISAEEMKLLEAVSCAYRDACSHVSRIAFEKRENNAIELQKLTYSTLREKYGLKSQMAISVTRTVAAKYKEKGRFKVLSSPAEFSHLQCDQVSGRDWSIDLEKRMVCLNTLGKRIKVPFSAKGFWKHLGKDAVFGGAKLILKDGRACLYVSVKRTVSDFVYDSERVVGMDRGIINTAVTYDGKKTVFYSGKKIKEKRAKFKEARRSLQKRNTPSSRRRLKAIGRRESRYVSDVDHCLTKTLVANAQPGTTFVLEDLSGVRAATTMVRRRDRYVMVSWPYHDLQEKLEYKAGLAGCAVLYVDPRHTSQSCPVCRTVDRNARDRSRRLYTCRTCGYSSNNDRLASMNIRQRGLETMEKSDGYICQAGVLSTIPRCDATGMSKSDDGETAGIKGRRLKAVCTAGQSQAITLQGGGS